MSSVNTHWGSFIRMSTKYLIITVSHVKHLTFHSMIGVGFLKHRTFVVGHATPKHLDLVFGDTCGHHPTAKFFLCFAVPTTMMLSPCHVRKRFKQEVKTITERVFSAETRAVRTRGLPRTQTMISISVHVNWVVFTLKICLG